MMFLSKFCNCFDLFIPKETTNVCLRLKRDGRFTCVNLQISQFREHSTNSFVVRVSQPQIYYLTKKCCVFFCQNMHVWNISVNKVSQPAIVHRFYSSTNRKDHKPIDISTLALWWFHKNYLFQTIDQTKQNETRHANNPKWNLWWISKATWISLAISNWNARKKIR